MCRILVVEDGASQRNALVALLADEGYALLDASCGGEALAAAVAQAPEIVIMDYGLPDMTGAELVTGLTRLGSPPRVVVVTGTSALGFDATGECRFVSTSELRRALGVAAVLEKPLRFSALLAVLRRLCAGDVRPAAA